MSIWLIIRAALFVMPSVVVLLVMTYPARPATTFVASNVGNDAAGTPCTDSVPCSVRRAILTANCANNDVIELLDGTYTGANYMLDVFNYAGSKSGTDDTHRCTIRARNDGGVLIDGQNTRTPLWLQGNSWWTVEGINARDGDDVFFVKNSSNLILRRLVGWDTKSLVDRKVFIVESSTNVLVEDVGAFGLAVETILDYGNNVNVKWRRVWTRTEGQVFTPSVCCTGSTANQFNYTTANHPTPSLIENIIQLAGPDRGSEGIAAVTNWIRHDALTPFVRFFGTMHYVTTGAPTMHFGSIAYDGNPEACTGYIITDSVVHANGSASRPIQVGQGATPAQGCDGSNPGAPQQLTRVNSVRGSTASTYGHATLTNVNESTTIGGTGFDYVGTGNTAKLCFRYVDGVYTATPLWPWPMDGRIKAAIEMNAGRGSVALTGGAGTGYQAGTVTSEIASIFGPIPAACNSSGGPFVPNFPTASDFPSTPIIDDFNRANGSIGPNYTWAVGSGYTISGNLALAPVGATRGWWNADTFTASHEVYATWPTVPSGDSVLLTFAGPDLADNGYHLILTRSGGNAFLRVARITGGYTEILGPINLGTDVANGQSFGIRVSPTQTISMYWKYSDGLWYRIGSVIDTNLPATARIGVGGILSNTINDLGGGTCCGGAVSPANIGRFGTRFPTQ